MYFLNSHFMFMITDVSLLQGNCMEEWSTLKRGTDTDLRYRPNPDLNTFSLRAGNTENILLIKTLLFRKTKGYFTMYYSANTLFISHVLNH